MNEVTRSMNELGRQMREMTERREARRKALFLRPNGTHKPAYSQNRHIHEVAILREDLPPVPKVIRGQGTRRGQAPLWHAEMWLCYSALRQEWLRMREQNPELCARLKEMGHEEEPDALNGYVAFPKRQAPRLPIDAGLLQFIPVHGGITYENKDGFAAVWGFDTAHWNSSKVPRTDPDWMRSQCKLLYTGLVLADHLWPEYRRGSEKRKREIAEWMTNLMEDMTVPMFERMGFGALTSILFTRKMP